MTDYTLEQLINLPQLETLLESHVQISGMACGLMDNEQNIIIGAGLQQVCTHFLWEHPDSFARCWRNDPEIKQALDRLSGNLYECRCKNGMINIAMPIIIDGKRLGVFFSGQFFYDNEPPDLAWFQNQAEELGFDVEAYLAAVRKVPLLSRSQVDTTMRFLHQLVQMLADTGYTNLMRLRKQQEHLRVEHELLLLSKAIDASSEPTYLMKSGGRFIYVNRAACDALNYSRDELLTMSPLDIDPDITPEAFGKLWDGLFAADAPILPYVESRHRTKGGRLFPVELKANVVSHDGNQYVLVVARDITERKQTEQHLKLLGFALDQVRDGIILKDIEEGRFRYVNQETCRSLEYHREELLHLSALDINPSLTAASYRELGAALLENGSITFETTHRTKSSRFFPVEVAVTIFTYEDTRYSFALVRDISERKQMELQLQQQVAFQQTLLDGINRVGIQVMIVENGRIIHVANRDLAHDFGYTDAELDTHPPFIDLIHPDERERVMDYHQRRLAGKAVPTTYELGLVTKAGELRHYETAVVKLPDTDPVRLITVGRDITQRKQAEQQLKLLNYALDHIRESAFLFDYQGRLLYVNQQACRSLGYSREALLGMDFQNIDPDLSPEFRTQHLADLERQKSLTFERQHRTQSGHLLPVEITSSLFAYGDTRYILSLVRDITERKQREELLKTQERKFRALAENSPDNIVRYDTRCRMIYVNPRMEKTLGIPAADLLGKTPTDKPPGPERNTYQERIKQVLTTGEEAEIDLILPDSSQGERHHNIRFVAERDDNGTVVGVLAIGRDITERKQAEQRLHEKQQRLNDLALELTLSEERERRRIAVDLHDTLGQDLTLTRMKLGGLKKAGLLPEHDDIVTELDHLAETAISRVRSLTRLLSPPILESAGLEAALKWLARQMETDYHLNINFFDDQQDKPVSREYQIELYNSVRELLINVAKHAETGTVCLSVGREADMLVIQVEDDGIGFDVEQALNNPVSDGFGLCTIKRRMLQMNGSCSITSRPGSGTEVTIRVPLLHVPPTKTA